MAARTVTGVSKTVQTSSPVAGGHVRLDLLCALNLCRWKGSSTSVRHLQIVNEILEEDGHDVKHEEPVTMPKDLDFRCSERSFPTSWLRALQEFCAVVQLGFDGKGGRDASGSGSGTGGGGEGGGAVSSGGGGSDSSSSSSSSDKTRGREAVAQVLAEGSESHLILRTCEGYLIPIEFDGPPLFDASGKVPGGWVGSTQRLMQELLELAPQLDIILRPLKGRVRRGGGLDLSASCIKDLERDLSCSIRARDESKEVKAAGMELSSSPPPSSSSSSSSSATAPHAFFRERGAWYVLYEAARLSQRCKSAMILRS